MSEREEEGLEEEEEEDSKDTAVEKPKKMKRVLGMIGSTRSNSEVTSVISIAQHKAFGYLKLEDFGPEEGTRSRTHVNPLAIQYSKPTPGPKDWKEWYANPLKPLGIDVGCAAGRFTLTMATGGGGNFVVPEEFRDINHLGLEIRRPYVERATSWAEGVGVATSVHFLVSSANVSLKSAVEGYPGKISFICVQFPDPHFKRKKHKRRVVTSEFIQIVSELLADDGWFFVQSDVEEAAAQMRDRIDVFKKEFRRDGDYTPRDPKLIAERVCSGEGEEYWSRDGKRDLEGGSDYGDWRIGPNPMGVPTEREVQNEALNLPIYRALFKRNPRT